MSLPAMSNQFSGLPGFDSDTHSDKALQPYPLSS